MARLTKKDKEIITKCEKLWKKKYVSKTHSVSAIVLSKDNKIYEGMSMEFDCGMDVCAERVGFFKMMPEKRKIKTVVAMYSDKILPPCGVCREMMAQMDRKNLDDTWVIISRKEKVKLKELHGHTWQKVFD